MSREWVDMEQKRDIHEIIEELKLTLGDMIDEINEKKIKIK